MMTRMAINVFSQRHRIHVIYMYFKDDGARCFSMVYL